MKELNTTRTNLKNTCTYGGEIYPSDFDTESNGTPFRRQGSFIASRIVCDTRFDEQCLRNAETLQRVTTYNAPKHPQQP